MIVVHRWNGNEDLIVYTFHDLCIEWHIFHIRIVDNPTRIDLLSEREASEVMDLVDSFDLIIKYEPLFEVLIEDVLRK